jgi:hypothetical protein
MEIPKTGQILVKVPAGAEADPPMEKWVRDFLPGMRRSGRYLRAIMRQPDFDKAVRLVMVILAHALHSTRDMDDIFEEDDSRWAYLQFVLGACREVAAACDLPPSRAKKLMAGALYSYGLAGTPSVARQLAREAAALDGAPGLEVPLAAGHAATRAWLTSEEFEVMELFRIFSLDPLLADATPAATRRH